MTLERLPRIDWMCSLTLILGIVALGTISVTPTHADVEKINLGSSPRASIHLLQACKASAAIDGRDYVTPDDVKSLLFPILNHRLIIDPDYLLRNISTGRIIDYNLIQKLINEITSDIKPPR